VRTRIHAWREQGTEVKLYVDTADIAEARSAVDLGVIDGITTNPSRVAKHGRELKDLVQELAALVKGEICARSSARMATVASVRGPGHVRELAQEGVHAFTMSLKVLRSLAEHPMTDDGLKRFRDDW
jgi:transaldolase